MDEVEFDKFVDEYSSLHARNISASGESPDFFSEYKIRDVASEVRKDVPAPQSLLDFGSGIGNSVPYIGKYFPDTHLTGADVSQRSIDFCRKKFAGAADFVKINGNQLPFPENGFDLLFSACVFHHIDHAEHHHWLSELNRVAKAGARLFIFEHNPLNPLTVSAVRTCPFDENAHLIPSWTLSQRVASAGWSNVKVRYRIFFPRALASLRSFEPYLSKVPFGAQYYVSATKAHSA